jgi:hypothetical protein
LTSRILSSLLSTAWTGVHIHRIKPSILLAALALGICVSGCATYRTVTFRAPQVVVFDGTPPIADVAKVHYRTYESAVVDSSRWVDGGISVFSDGERLGKLRFMDIDSVVTGSKRVFTLLPNNFASIDSIYYGRNNIDRPYGHRWVDGGLETVVGDDARLIIHRFNPVAMDSMTVTFQGMNLPKTGLVILGVIAGILGVSLVQNR